MTNYFFIAKSEDEINDALLYYSLEDAKVDFNEYSEEDKKDLKIFKITVEEVDA